MEERTISNAHYEYLVKRGNSCRILEFFMVLSFAINIACALTVPFGRHQNETPNRVDVLLAKNHLTEYLYHRKLDSYAVAQGCLEDFQKCDKAAQDQAYEEVKKKEGADFL